MSHEIARQGGSSLAITSDQDFWTERQKAALAQIGVKRASNGDLAVFFHQCQRTGLDPFARQIYMIERQGKQTIQTGIDGFRLIASRTGELTGFEDTLWCGEDGQWTDVWLSKTPPAAAKATVLRNGARYPAVALFEEYKGVKRNGELNQMWATKGAHMLAKCAEALALRKAFPQDLSGLYTSDEMDQADNGPQPAQQVSSQRVTPQPQESAPSQPASGMDQLAAAVEPATVDPESFLARVEQTTDVDELRSLWMDAARLPGDQVEDVRAIITARVTLAQDQPEPEPESGPEQPTLDGEIVEDGAA